MGLKQSISTGPSGLMLSIKLPLKIYNIDMFIIVTECCVSTGTECVFVQRHLTFSLAEHIVLHLFWTLLLPVFKRKHSCCGHVQVGNEECLGTKKPAASFSSVFKTGRVGLYQLLEKPPLWESLSSVNGRQIPRRAVEIAWKRLKRDPHSVVSLAFHCSWQTQEGTLLMKTLKKHWMLMKTNNFIPRCSWHGLRHDGRWKVPVNRPII